MIFADDRAVIVAELGMPGESTVLEIGGGSGYSATARTRLRPSASAHQALPWFLTLLG
jgi:protein-L-isoaspartate O-methyltransferase